MELGAKLVQLRTLAGEQRGLGRAMTQTEVAQAVRTELGVSLSQAYLSQLERGKRVHLSNTSRATLARFFQVHPGYLVSDLPGHGDTSCAIPAALTQQFALVEGDALRNVHGLALAPDLGERIQGARQRSASTFPASERRDVPIAPAIVPVPATPHAPTWIGDPVPANIPIVPGSAGFYPRHGQWEPSRRPPVRTEPPLVGVDARLRSLLSRLRDHPQAGRVLALAEQIARLTPEALDETEALVRRLAREE